MNNDNLLLAPVDDSNRIRSIDVLRGIALLGILLMNIPEFSMPRRYSESFRNDPGSIDFWVRAIVLVFFEGKMRALFCMIFGAGILLFIANKAASAKTIAWLFYRRMGWLIVFGLADAHLLLWSGDILYFYGVIGMIAFLFRKVNPKYLALGIPLVAVIEFTIGTIFYQDIREKRLEYVAVNNAIAAGQSPSEAQKKAVASWREIEQSFLPNDQDIREHTQIMKSGYTTIAPAIRKESFSYQTQYLVYSLWDPLALMLLGMALFKWGVFSNQWPGKKYRRMALIGYGLGLPLVIFEFCYYYFHVPDLAAYLSNLEKTPVSWIGLIYPFQRILLVLAHTSVIMLIFRSGRFSRLFSALTAVGKMALTNYVMQTVICTWFFFGYGLNYFGELGYYQLFYVVTGIWVLQLLLSQWWLKWFHFGPLEWLWRSLTYWKRQPFRKADKKTYLTIT